MSLSSLCDHSSLPSSYSLQNAHSFLPVDRLSRRRRPHGDDRLHRHRRGEMGPDLCQRKLDPIHSFPNATKFVGTDGAIEIGQKELKRIAPALAENLLNLPNFGVPYSLNRQKRWHLTKLSAAQLNTPESQENDSRVSIVWQKANPMRKGTVNGRFERFWPGLIGRFGEENVAKLSTFDAENEINRVSKSARGANSTAQLMQKGIKPKKRSNRRTENVANEQQVERWLDLFQPRDYSVVNPSPTVSDGARPPPVHNYYAFRTQSASRHQLNSGWQDKRICKGMTKEELREGGRWAKDWQGNAKWEALSRRQIGLCLQNGPSPVVQKRRGIACAKGGERFAIEADIEEHFQLPERIDEDENENEEENVKMEVEKEQKSEERDAERTERKPMEIGDFLMMANSKKRGRNANAETKRVNRRSVVKGKHLQIMVVLKEDEEEDATRSSTSDLSFADEEKQEKEEHKLCQLTTGEVGTIKAKLAEFMPLDDDRNGLLPCGTSILQCQPDNERINGICPPGALLIIRKYVTEEKYLINPPTSLGPSFADRNANNEPKNCRNKPMETMKASSSSLCYNNSCFLSDLLSSASRRRNLRLIETDPLYDEAATDAEAERLLFVELEQRMDEDGDQQKQGEQMPCHSASSSAFSADNCPAQLPIFCGVCFVECAAFDSFALRRCEPFGATHTFCDDCWRQHIGQCLSNGRVPISCMAPNCSSVVRPSVALLVVGQPIAQRYRQLMVKRRRLCRDFVVCAQCDGTVRLRLNWQSLASLSRKSQPLAKCAHCEEIFCCRCAQRQHLPLSCEERELYELILRSHGQSLQSLLLSPGLNRIARGVRCDNCNNLVEKNNGCDHIVCVCGYEFCWRCGGDWKRHRNCVGQGRINVPLFDLVFVNGPNGRKLAKSPEKFFAECAEFRAFRQPNGRKLFKLMDQIFGNDRPRGRQWAEKYLQVSEFVELCLAKRQISGKKSDDFSAATDRLRFTFRTIPFIAKMDDKTALTIINREMVEQNYEQIVAISKQIIQMIR
ncbi:hypothetical protein niasHT_016896 [Heterodera trifolii]|uniref:RBR-type E3 ubiquitin transferase n=1 Tax=Heterodera trifolii TaxID=157864 RepID=A0ABD2KV78_9BILA